MWSSSILARAGTVPDSHDVLPAVGHCDGNVECLQDGPALTSA